MYNLSADLRQPEGHRQPVNDVERARDQWYFRWSLARLRAREWCRNNNWDDEENRGEVEFHVSAVWSLEYNSKGVCGACVRD